MAIAPGTKTRLPSKPPMSELETVLQALRVTQAQLDDLRSQVRATSKPARSKSQLIAAVAALVTALLGGGGLHSWMQTPALTAVRDDVRALRQAHDRDHKRNVQAWQAGEERAKILTAWACMVNGGPIVEDADCRARPVVSDARPLGEAWVPARLRVTDTQWPHVPRPGSEP